MSDGITEAYKNVQTLTHDHKQETPYTKQIWAYLEKVEADNAALREQVKRLSTCGTDHSTPWWQVKCEDLEAQLATLQAQLRQAEGQSQQQAEEAVIVFAKYTTLRQLLEDVLHTFGYLRFHRVAGMDGLLYETHNKMSPERTVEACEKRIRATLAAKDAGKEVSSG